MKSRGQADPLAPGGLVYDLAAQGDEPQQLAVHEGELFVCSADSVLVFDPQGEGNLSPLRQLTVVANCLGNSIVVLPGGEHLRLACPRGVLITP
jgi:hypothetical protein